MNQIIIDPNEDTKRSEGGRILLPPPPQIVIVTDFGPPKKGKKPNPLIPREFAGYDVPIIGQAPQLH